MSFLVIWMGLTVGLTMWHFAKIKAAGKPENRARLWEKRKHKYTFNENMGEWNYITGKTHEGVTFSTQSRNERLVHESKLKQAQKWAMPMLYGFSSIPLTAFIEIFPDMLDTTKVDDGAAKIVVGIILLGFALFGIGCGWMTLWGECRGGPYFGGDSGMVIDPPARSAAVSNHGPGVGVVDELTPETDQWKPYE